MLPRDYDGQICSVARALEVIGERWSLLIVRDVLLGTHRFDELQHSLGVTRSVLSVRLGRLVDEDVLERRRYQQHPERYEYHLTDKGLALRSVILQLLIWGDRFYAHPDGPPRLLVHRGCGGHPDHNLRCARCDEPLSPEMIEVTAGPAILARRTRATAAKTPTAA